MVFLVMTEVIHVYLRLFMTHTCMGAPSLFVAFSYMCT